MGLLKRDLKKGDRVVISTSYIYYNTSSYNPPNSVRGTVTSDGLGSVVWDNGAQNSYDDYALIKVSEMSPESSEFTKSPTIGKWYTNPNWQKGSIAKFRAITLYGEFGFSESISVPDTNTNKRNGSWSMMSPVRLATESELRILPKDHPDHPDYKAEKKTKFIPKVGDTVRIIGNSNNSSNKIGDIGTITAKFNSTTWRVQVPDGPKYYTCTKEYDMEKVDSSLLSNPLSPVDMPQYTQKSTYDKGDKVTVRLIKDLEKESYKPSKYIPLGQYMICDGAYFANPKDSSYLHPDGNKYRFNFPREWFQILGIHKRDISVELGTRRSAVLDPITGHPKIWRVKTQQEMIDEGIMKSHHEVPSGWSKEMKSYFGKNIDSKYYDNIEETQDNFLHQWSSRWWFRKLDLTTKTIPWDISNVKDFSNISFDSDDEDDEDLNDEVSWFDNEEEDDLDKLDKMSELVQIKRPKQVVEIIPHKSRKIF